jgi:hypothetical protein
VILISGSLHERCTVASSGNVYSRDEKLRKPIQNRKINKKIPKKPPIMCFIPFRFCVIVLFKLIAFRLLFLFCAFFASGIYRRFSACSRMSTHDTLDQSEHSLVCSPISPVCGTYQNVRYEHVYVRLRSTINSQ